MAEGLETALFKQYFSAWDESSEDAFVESKIAGNILTTYRDGADSTQ